MQWNEYCSKSDMPDMAKISDFVSNPLWDELCSHLDSSYGIFPEINYSLCSAAPGWNVKYRKSGRALCTLYPDDGFFTCLISIGTREAMEAELLLTDCTESVRKLYWDTKPFNGGRWLMISVTSPEILNDAKRLIALRIKSKKNCK